MESNQYELDRSNKLEKIRALGFNPYGDTLESSIMTGSCLQLSKRCLDPDGKPLMELTMADGPEDHGRGRIVLRRPMGNLHFLTVRDSTGDMQVALNKKLLPEKDWELAKLLDLADIVEFHGRLAPTKAGEPTLWATALRMSTKALATPPAKVEGLQDVEQRYRKRYVDLWSNPDVMKTMQARSRILRSIRKELYDADFDEVETPSLQSIAGGAAATPFVTHHKALNIPLYMRIAPELFLKRLLVGGMPRIFEIGRNFRNEGISTKHNPEFTALELYEAYSDYERMADLAETIIFNAAYAVGVQSKFAANGVGFRRVKMIELVKEYQGVSTFDAWEMEDGSLTPEQIHTYYEQYVEPNLIEPTFVTHFPASKVPLAKSENGYALAWELVINGIEVGCGYSEQNDPYLQLEAFKAQGTEIDMDFIEAQRVGMPPAGGLGIGLDRLVMVLTGASSIRDVILFPTLKPKAE